MKNKKERHYVCKCDRCKNALRCLDCGITLSTDWEFEDKRCAQCEAVKKNGRRKFSPRKYPNVLFPNWFEKTHAEQLTGREINKKEWERIVDYCPDDLADGVSESFSIWLHEWFAEQEENKA